MDLKDGPVVVESPPGVLGLVNDFTFKYVADIGRAGPDKGKGGKFLFLPPGYEGKAPEGYFAFQSPTYGNLLAIRAFPTEEDPQAGVKAVEAHLKVYRLSGAKNPPQMKSLNWSGKEMNTVHGNDFSFYEEVNTVIQVRALLLPRSGDPGPPCRHRHSKGKALRAGCPHEENPCRGRSGRQRHGPCPLFRHAG